MSFFSFHVYCPDVILLLLGEIAARCRTVRPRTVSLLSSGAWSRIAGRMLPLLDPNVFSSRFLKGIAMEVNKQ